MRRLTEKEGRKYKEDCEKFKDYKDSEEYKEDVVICLVYSSWHYSEEEARELVNSRSDMIEEEYEAKTPADDCAADVGYFCG